jgi:predicted  nucleic acid-binding Zn-ribbon protein
LKDAGITRALAIRNLRIRKFQADVEAPKVEMVDKKAAMLRGMLVEDCGSTLIRRARREYIERKEREAAARAEAESKAIAQGEESAEASAEDAQRTDDPESLSDT